MMKICAKIDAVIVRAKAGICSFVKEEQGDFGVGQIAGIVAAVVIIGLVLGLVTDRLPDFIDDLWTTITGWFDMMRI